MRIEEYLRALVSRREHLKNKVRTTTETSVSPTSNGNDNNVSVLSMKNQIKFIKRLGRDPSMCMCLDPKTAILPFYENEIKNSLLGYTGKDCHTLMTILQYLDLNSPGLMQKVADCLLKEAVNINMISIISEGASVPNIEGTKDGKVDASPKWYSQVISKATCSEIITNLQAAANKLKQIIKLLNYMCIYGLTDNYFHLSSVGLHLMKLLKLSLTVSSGFQIFRIFSDNDISDVVGKKSPHIVIPVSKAKTTKAGKKSAQTGRDVEQEKKVLNTDQYHPISIGSISFIERIGFIPVSMDVLRYESPLFKADSLRHFEYIVPAHLAHPAISLFPVVKRLIWATTIKHVDEFLALLTTGLNKDRKSPSSTGGNTPKVGVGSDDKSDDNDLYSLPCVAMNASGEDLQAPFGVEFIQNIKDSRFAETCLSVITEDQLFSNRYIRPSSQATGQPFERFCSYPTIPSTFKEVYGANVFRPTEQMQLFVLSFRAILSFLSIMYSHIAIYNRYLVRRSEKLNNVLAYGKAYGKLSNIRTFYRARQILLTTENEFIQNYLLFLLKLDGGFAPRTQSTDSVLRTMTSSPGSGFLFSVKSNNDVVIELFRDKRNDKLSPSDSFYISRDEEDLYLHFLFDRKSVVVVEKGHGAQQNSTQSTPSGGNIKAPVLLKKERGTSIGNLNKTISGLTHKEFVAIGGKMETGGGTNIVDEVCSINAAEKRFNRSILSSVLGELGDSGEKSPTSGSRGDGHFYSKLVRLLPTLSSIHEADEWISLLIEQNKAAGHFSYDPNIIRTFLGVIARFNDYSVVHCAPYIARILATLYWHGVERSAVETVVETHARRAYGSAKGSVETIEEYQRTQRKDKGHANNVGYQPPRMMLNICLFECCFLCELAKFGLILPSQFMKYVEFCSRLKNVIVTATACKTTVTFNVTLYRCLCLILINCGYYILSLKTVGESAVKTILGTLEECPFRRSFDVDKESLVMQKDAAVSLNIATDVYNDVHTTRMSAETSSLAKNLYQRILRKLMEKEDEIPVEVRLLETIMDGLDKTSVGTESKSMAPGVSDGTDESHLGKAKFVAFFALDDWTSVELYGDNQGTEDGSMSNDGDGCDIMYETDKSSCLAECCANTECDLLPHLGTGRGILGYPQRQQGKKVTVTRIINAFISSLLSTRTIPMIADLLKDMIWGKVEGYLSDQRLYILSEVEQRDFSSFLASNMPTFIANCNYAASALITAAVDTLWRYATHRKASKDVEKAGSRVVQLSHFVVALALRRTDNLSNAPVLSHTAVLRLATGILSCGIGGFVQHTPNGTRTSADIFVDINEGTSSDTHFLACYLPTSLDVLPPPNPRLMSPKTRIICVGLLLEGVFWANLNGSLNSTTVVTAANTRRSPRLPRFPPTVVAELRCCFFLFSCLLWSFIRRKGYKRCSLYDGSGFVPMLQRLVAEFGDLEEEIRGNGDGEKERERDVGGGGEERKGRVIHRIWLPCNSARRIQSITSKFLCPSITDTFGCVVGRLVSFVATLVGEASMGEPSRKPLWVGSDKFNEVRRLLAANIVELTRHSSQRQPMNNQQQQDTDGSQTDKTRDQSSTGTSPMTAGPQGFLLGLAATLNKAQQERGKEKGRGRDKDKDKDKEKEREREEEAALEAVSSPQKKERRRKPKRKPRNPKATAAETNPTPTPSSRLKAGSTPTTTLTPTPTPTPASTQTPHRGTPSSGSQHRTQPRGEK